MFLILYYEKNTYFYTSDYIKECNVCQQIFCNIYLVIIFKLLLGGAIPPSSTSYQGLSKWRNLLFIIYKKTYWDNTLNSYEGISIITRKGLKNGY